MIIVSGIPFSGASLLLKELNKSGIEIISGLTVADAHSNIIENNTFSACDSGIYMMANSSFNAVSFNNCSTNRIGIVLQSTQIVPTIL